MRFRKLSAVSGATALGLSVLLALSACAGGSSSGTDAEDDPATGPVPATAEQLVGTWVTGESYDSPELPFLTFAADGSWNGSDGCNGNSGEWSISSDGGLTTSAGLSTLMACSGAPLPKSLTKASKALIDDGSLLLTDGDGATIVTLVPSDDSTADATEGAAAGDDAGAVVGGAAGTWRAETPAGVDVHLTLAADGSVSGSDGCNTLTGSWTEADGVVTFGGLASTKKACEGVDTWLSRANALSFDGSSATVVDAAGAQIGTLRLEG
ncbi:META domain-containing protein [Herbiconiux sp. A18JL235]|uniref:META domain-containing protein n=1 Tax=Herbiconiux sp. A18JL235 TaxID=3152363 RepID=A0AB39BLZ1_9MICO